MMGTDTFLTLLYVMADDFCKYHLPPEKTPGPRASLTRSEVITLALFGQWSHSPSERGLYRYASKHLRPAFPTLPYRGQFNRLTRQHYGTIAAFFRHLVALLQAQESPYEALDSTGAPTRENQSGFTTEVLKILEKGQAGACALPRFIASPLMRGVSPRT
jgi:hypothetical protein